MIKDFIISGSGRRRLVYEARDESRPLSDATLMPCTREKRSGSASPIPATKTPVGEAACHAVPKEKAGQLPG